MLTLSLIYESVEIILGTTLVGTTTESGDESTYFQPKKAISFNPK